MTVAAVLAVPAPEPAARVVPCRKALFAFNGIGRFVRLPDRAGALP